MDANKDGKTDMESLEASAFVSGQVSEEILIRNEYF
jgi:hypothetical protein